jgi:DNA polymerase I
MTKRSLQSSLLLQVHDELIFEVPEDEINEIRNLAIKVMSEAIELSIPIKVDTKTGMNWGQME